MLGNTCNRCDQPCEVELCFDCCCEIVLHCLQLAEDLTTHEEKGS
jgi:hypothetical protein